MANKRIENLIASGRWEIETVFGLNALARYYSELDLVSDGVSLSDLKYSERRLENAPRIVGLQPEPGTRVNLSDRTIESGSIAHLRLSGVMRMEDGLSSTGIRTLIEDIRTADANPRISGILLEVNSGGGESESGSELLNAIQDVRDRGQTRFGVYTQLLASAALRGTLPAEFVLASGNGSLIGSIGTYTSISVKALEEYREDIVDIYARQSKMKNQDVRSLVNDGKFELLEDFVTESAQVFIDEVFKYREISGTLEEIYEVESGKLFFATEAMSRGLISGVGTFADAVGRLKGVDRSEGQFGPTGPVGPPGMPQRNQRKIEIPVARELFNQSFNNMKSLISFVAAIIPGLNEKLGLDLKDDATATEVVDAIQSATGIETLRDELETANQEAADNLAKQLQELTDKFGSLEETVSGLTAANQTLSESNQSLSEEIADLKGRSTNQDADGVSGSTNSSAPNMEEFKTVRSFEQSFTPANGSKYSK